MTTEKVVSNRGADSNELRDILSENDSLRRQLEEIQLQLSSKHNFNTGKNYNNDSFQRRSSAHYEKSTNSKQRPARYSNAGLKTSAELTAVKSKHRHSLPLVLDTPHITAPPSAHEQPIRRSNDSSSRLDVSVQSAFSHQLHADGRRCCIVSNAALAANSSPSVAQGEVLEIINAFSGGGGNDDYWLIRNADGFSGKVPKIAVTELSTS